MKIHPIEWAFLLLVLVLGVGMAGYVASGLAIIGWRILLSWL